MFFQRLCEKRLAWDGKLDEQLGGEWFALLNSLVYAKPVRISIWYLKLDGMKGEATSVSLHGFCDASTEVYAAVVYLRVETAAEVHPSFVTFKVRVAPLARQSIPRLVLP